MGKAPGISYTVMYRRVWLRNRARQLVRDKGISRAAADVRAAMELDQTQPLDRPPLPPKFGTQEESK